MYKKFWVDFNEVKRTGDKKGWLLAQPWEPVEGERVWLKDGDGNECLGVARRKFDSDLLSWWWVEPDMTTFKAAPLELS